MQSKSDSNTALLERAEKHLPGGVNSNVRLSGPKVFFERGEGAWLWDTSGQDYVDYLLGQGPNFLGHAPRPVLDAVDRASRRGMIYGAQHELEVEAAELFCSVVGWPEMVRFGLSGSEAVQAALRLARAVTGRRKFVRFAGHYHGWLDNVLLGYTPDGPVAPSAGQVADYLNDAIVIPWNDAARLEEVLVARSEEVAAVIMEPMMLNAGSIWPLAGYLQRVRSLCDEHGVVLIFDEVITGFRLGLGGAAGRFGVEPDLATYGKAMAGGWPVSALAGRGEYMGRFGTGEVNHSGTFNGSVMACAAVVATLQELQARPPHARLEELGERLMTELPRLAENHGIPMRTQGCPIAFHASIGEGEEFHDFAGLQERELDRYEGLAKILAANGVWVAGRGIWYLSAAHTSSDVDVTLERVDAALAAAGR